MFETIKRVTRRYKIKVKNRRRNLKEYSW